MQVKSKKDTLFNKKGEEHALRLLHMGTVIIIPHLSLRVPQQACSEHRRERVHMLMET